jgi:transcriptional regulator with XRE-family HTH domain
VAPNLLLCTLRVHDEPMTASAYGEILARNVKAARTGAGLDQNELAERMRSLGFSEWRFQTVGNVERGKRRLAAEELLGLALALETTIQHLVDPSEGRPGREGFVELPSGETVSSDFVTSLVYGMNAGAVEWADGKPEFGPETKRTSNYSLKFVDAMRAANSSRPMEIEYRDAGGSAVTFRMPGLPHPGGS